MTEQTEMKLEALPVTEIIEFLDGIKLLAVSGVKVFADGKVNPTDLAIIVDLAKQYDILAAAVKGLDKVPAEIKDIDNAEAIILVSKVFEIVTAIKNAK
jgi:hypothetical protein